MHVKDGEDFWEQGRRNVLVEQLCNCTTFIYIDITQWVFKKYIESLIFRMKRTMLLATQLLPEYLQCKCAHSFLKNTSLLLVYLNGYNFFFWSLRTCLPIYSTFRSYLSFLWKLRVSSFSHLCDNLLIIEKHSPSSSCLFRTCATKASPRDLSYHKLKYLSRPGSSRNVWSWPG